LTASKDMSSDIQLKEFASVIQLIDTSLGTISEFKKRLDEGQFNVPLDVGEQKAIKN
jgi:hypothetical protein